MLVGGVFRVEGIKGRKKRDNCNDLTNTIYFKKIKERVTYVIQPCRYKVFTEYVSDFEKNCFKLLLLSVFTLLQYLYSFPAEK